MAVIPFVTQIDFMSPRWNRDAWARIQADMDSEKQRICHCSGSIMAGRPREAVKPIPGFPTFPAPRPLPPRHRPPAPPCRARRWAASSRARRASGVRALPGAAPSISGVSVMTGI